MMPSSKYNGEVTSQISILIPNTVKFEPNYYALINATHNCQLLQPRQFVVVRGGVKFGHPTNEIPVAIDF